LNPTEIYAAMRSEITTNHILMHCVTFVVAIVLLTGVWLVESRRTILSVFLPLLTVAWAASIVRFDFFIHRQAAYLKQLESQLRDTGTVGPFWETWKASSRSTLLVVPLMDVLAVGVLVIPTLYILFGPAQEFYSARGWRWGRIYAWGLSVVLVLLLLFLAAVPRIAST
jgi:hypothetical protein